MKEPLFFSPSTAKGSEKSIASNYNYLDNGITVERSSATGIGRTFTDWDNNISIKSDYNRADYEYFRANLSSLTLDKKWTLSQKAYEKVGIIRNIIDTMSDLGCQGIRIQHPIPKTERFLQAWAEHVKMSWVSERFLSLLYRLCNVPIKSAYGQISWGDEDAWSKTKGSLDETNIEKVYKTKKRNIPLKYTFIHPSCIEVVGGAASLFIDKPYYVLKISDSLKQDLAKINSFGNVISKEEYEKLLSEVNSSIGNNSRYVLLDQSKFDIYFYKKDDWQVWANPYMESIFDDLLMLERMKLADMSALDGAISNIRHWKVGIIDTSNPNNSILPNKTAINRVRDVLANQLGGGTLDLVTGPEIEFKESNTQIHKFLGPEKYKVTLDNIYDGMGVPPPLRSSNASTNATNNYVSLKTLIERLQYGRNLLTSFWHKQLKIVQDAMGHSYPGQVMFDQMILSDEAAEKTLLIQLLDRDVISLEAVREYFGFIPEIEAGRTKREFKRRSKDNLPQKAGQFHNPQIKEDFKKIALQSGDITPGETGVRLKKRKAGEKPRVDKEQENQIKLAKFKPKKTINGRPKSVTETKKRKSKPNSKPRTTKGGFVDMLLWAEKAFAQINDTLSPALLHSYGKSNHRQLTNEESEMVEEIKFRVLANVTPFSILNDMIISTILDLNKPISSEIQLLFEESKATFIEKYNKSPSLDELRKMKVLAYVEVNCANN